VAIVIDRLTKANLRLNPEKCEFSQPSLMILGFDISVQGIRVAKEKLVVLEDLVPPINGKELERLLGFYNFFRDLIPMYSTLMAPLEKLRHASVIDWTPELLSILTNAKAILSSELVISHPDFVEPFYVGTDASSRGLGAVLY
jgi:hypothetical protein